MTFIKISIIIYTSLLNLFAGNLPYKLAPQKLRFTNHLNDHLCLFFILFWVKF